MLPALYTPRSRASNIAIIRAVITAASEEDHAAARRAFSDALHPSLFSELDFMEETVPPSARDHASRIVEDLSNENLLQILCLRLTECDLPDDALLIRVNEERPFFESLVVETFHLPGLSEQRRLRVRAALAASAPNPSRDARVEELRRALVEAQDPWQFRLLVEAAIQNAVLHHLDSQGARWRTRQWLRTCWDGQLPRVGWRESDGAGISFLGAELETLRTQALAHSLKFLEAVAVAAAEELRRVELGGGLQPGGGAWAKGVGPCARCSMRFASVGQMLVRESSVGEADEASIVLPLFNVVQCPFCGEIGRINAPALFYSEARAQAVYCVPRLDGQSAEEALHAAAPALHSTREALRAELSEEQWARFGQAEELLTGSALEFLLAIQMGTTNVEWHAFLEIELSGGQTCILDPTKGVMIPITRLEQSWFNAHFTEDRPEVRLDPPTPDEPTAPLAGKDSAKRAFAEGRTSDAMQLLEAALRANPGDTIVRRNLAAVCIKTGLLEKAKAVLAGREYRLEEHHA